eukprot:EC715331.1.p1 GENE.EC715331.1~~EC715331.1.p1  ORF type:complete len:114 (+),score=24.62 EC715331.1:27-344(+)
MSKLPVPEGETVKLVSSDGKEFVVEKKAALVSGTIKSMLSSTGGTFAESSGEIRFQEINGQILEKVIEYFYYKLKYNNATSDVPEFPIQPEIAMSLLEAANFLDT